MYLGIDMGTSSVKAILTDGAKRFKDKEAYSFIGNDCQHPVSAVETAIKNLIKRIIKNTDQEIKGIGICGHGPSVVFIDKDGKPLTDIVTWQDKRADEEALFLRQKFPGFIKDATSYEAKVLWFFKNHPSLFDAGNTVLYPKDYLVYLLCDRRVIDRSAASTIPFFNRKENSWEFDRMGLPNQVFPDVVESTEVVSHTSTKFSKDCELADGIPVYGGGIDAFCEIVGAGGINPGDVVEGTGTSTCISFMVEEDDHESLHVMKGLSLMMRSVSYSGGSVKWWRSICAENNLCEELVAGGKITPSGVIFLPYLMGERSPIWDEKASGVFFGMTDETDRRDMWVSVLEGVAFSLRHNLETLKDRPVGNEIRAVGGGANNLAWLQIKANITGKTYLKMKELDAGALGAALLCAMADWEGDRDELVSQWIGIEKVVKPDLSLQSQYDGLYEVYKNLYPVLKESFHTLKNIQKA